MFSDIDLGGGSTSPPYLYAAALIDIPILLGRYIFVWDIGGGRARLPG